MLFPAFGIFVCVSSLANAQYLLGLAEGEICNDKQGQWVCTAHKQCTHVDLKLTRPSICSFRGRDPIICCPPKKKISKAEISCLKYTELCNQFHMFRSAPGQSALRKPLEWTEDDGHEAAVLEIPSDILVEVQTSGYTESVISSTQSSVVSVPNSTEGFAANSLDVAGVGGSTTPGSPTGNQTSGDVPKTRQFVLGGQFSLPRTHRHVVLFLVLWDCHKYKVEVTCPKLRKPGEVHIAVVGGTESKSKTQLHMALIGYGPRNNIDWRCGGSLISDLWVLSAAHCTTTADIGSAKWARLGELDHSSDADDARPQDRRIVQRINHPQYKETLKYNDIALYKLESRVLFDQYVAPICLHTSFDIDQPKATVVGWGRTDFADDLSSKLMEVDITLINNSDCRQMYGSGDPTVPQGIERLTMLCAGEREGGKDACTGDSGGPLVINQAGSCLKKQVGITSFGRDCGLPNSPGIYTRVSTYVPWIESIVWP